MGKRLNTLWWLKTGMIVCMVLGIVTFAMVWADGDTRATTLAEKQFIKTVFDTFAKSVPPGPAGWDQTGDKNTTPETKWVTDVQLPLRVEYYISWQDSKRIQEGEQKVQEELLKLMQGPAANLTDEKINEIEKRETPHDVNVKIDISANILSQGIYEKVKPAASIAGGLVYQSEGEYRSSWREGATYVFLGSGWKADQKSSTTTTYVNFTHNKSLPFHTVQNIVVVLRAEPKRATQIIAKIDWEALKKLIIK